MCHGAIEALVQGTTLRDDGLSFNLANHAPLVLQLLRELKAETLPQAAVPFFLALLRVAKAPFSGPLAPAPPVTHSTPTDYYPSLPKVQERGSYRADAARVMFSGSPQFPGHDSFLGSCRCQWSAGSPTKGAKSSTMVTPC